MRKGLGYHNRRSPFGFNPGTLFAGGAAGAWYDPSDASTLFSDTAGTTPSPTPGAGALSVVGKMLDKSGNGNHAISYNTTTARPELSARVNLLTYSEQFDNAAWTKAGITVTANQGIAPNGTTTADLAVTNNGAQTNVAVTQDLTALAASTSYVMSAYVKKAGARYAVVGWLYTAGVYAAVAYDLDTATVSRNAAVGGFTITNTTISDVGSGWYRITVTATTPTTAGFSRFPGVYPRVTAWTSGSPDGADTGNGTDGVLLWGADLRPANIGASVPAYQRIADQYTYDSSGFPRYLVFNGTASGMYTPANLNLSGTAQATVFAGVRKQALTTGFVVETSAAAESNNGAFRVGVDSGGIEYFISSRGTVSQQVNIDNAAYLPPVSNVVQSSFDIAAPSVSVRLNGVAVGSNNSSQGTGNFGSYPLNVGARNVSGGTPTFLFNGYIYSLIVVGAASTAAQISSTESWINVKEGGVY